MKKTETVAFRLSLILGCAVVLVLGLSGWFMTNQAASATLSIGKANMQERVDAAANAISAYNEELESEAIHLSELFGYLYPGAFTLDNQKIDVAGQRVPTIKSGDASLAGNYQQVDNFAKATGGNATVFVRNGQDFVRVVTSVVKENGQRAVGTLLSRTSPAYSSNLNGEAFTGKVTLFGKRFVTNYSPIKNSAGEVIGIRYIGIEYTASLSNLRNGLAQQSVGENGYLFAIDVSEGKNKGELVIHPDYEGDQLAQVGTETRALAEALMSEEQGSFTLDADGGFGADQWEIVYQLVPELQWVIAAAKPYVDLNKTANMLALSLAIATLITIILVLALLIFTAKKIVGDPLHAAVDVIQEFANGDYSRIIQVREQGEIGQLQQALKTMQSNMSDVLKQMADSADNLAISSQELASTSIHVAQSSDEQNKASSSMAATVEQLTVSIEQLSGHANEARQMSEEANSSALEGGAVISKADDQMQQIASGVSDASTTIQELDVLSEEITSIIQVIETIAEQTNLLALNAAIEAARAGDQGRGFAVVADEVRSLASRTTESAHEITSMIGRMRENTQKSVLVMNQNLKEVQGVAELSQEAGRAIQTIEDGASNVVDIFREISTGLKEQSMASTETARNVESIVEMSENNRQAVSELAEASQKLEGLAGRTNDMLKQFRF